MVSSEFFKSVIKDFKDKEAWKLKLIYFFFLSGVVMIWAQISVHQITLNLSIQDISQMTTISSIIGILVPFLSGFVADKVGNFVPILRVLTLLLAINTVLFTFIPKTQMIQCISEEEIGQIQVSNSSKDFLEIEGSEIEPLESVSISDFDSRLQNNTEIDRPYASYNPPSLSLQDQGLCRDAINATSIRDKDSHAVTYWTYLLIRTSYFILLGASYTLYDSCVMAISKQGVVDYGLQRAWGTLAALISGFAGGKLVDVFSVGKETKDFNLMFYTSAACVGISGVIMLFVNLSFRLPAVEFTFKVIHDFKNGEAVILLIYSLFKGIMMSYAEIFMYIYMFGLGASQTLIGLTVTVGASIEILLQLMATPLSKALGKPTILFIGLTCYAIRFLGFSYIYNPYWVLLFEAFDAWSGLTSTVIYMHATRVCSDATLATFRGLMGSLHDGIGRIISANVGAMMEKVFDTRVAWRVMAAFGFAAALWYLITHLVRRFVQKLQRKEIHSAVFKSDAQEAGAHTMQGTENLGYS